MQLIHKSAVNADHGTIVLTGSGWRFFSSLLLVPAKDQARRGYLLKAHTFCQYMATDSWRAPVAVFVAAEPITNFGAAERVLRLPFSVGKAGELLLGGISSARTEMSRLPMARGDYSLFSLAYNLKACASDEQMEMSLEDFSRETNVERYDFVLVARRCTEPAVLKGADYLLPDVEA